MKAAGLLTVVLGVAAGAIAGEQNARAAQKLFVICYPGGSVKARDAEPAARQMLRALERMGGWPEGSFDSRFTTDAKECERLLAGRPPFAIVSLGEYLAHPGLVPLVQPEIQGRTTDTWRVLVRKGTFRSLDDLKGKTLGGATVDQTTFVDRLIFQGKARVADFVPRPSVQPLRALRSLAEGALDAVLLNDQQFRALGGLPFAADLEVVFTSAPLPLVGIVADGQKTTSQERQKLSGSLKGFCRDPQGRPFCEVFGIDAFVPVGASAYEPMRGLWK